MKAKWIAVSALAIACMSALLLAGCSSEPAHDIVLGDRDNAAHQVAIKNATEQEITSVAVAATGSEDSEEYLASGETWEADKTALLCVPEVEADATDDSESSSDEGDDVDVELKSTFDIVLTTEDGNEYTLHQVSVEGLAEAEEVTVCLSDSGLAYLSYTENGEEASTLEAETAIKEQAEAEAQAQAEAEAAAAAEAQAQAEAEAAAAAAAAQKSTSSSGSSSGGSSSSGSGSSSSNSSGSSSSGVSQSEDSCISDDDIILR